MNAESTPLLRVLYHPCHGTLDRRWWWRSLLGRSRLEDGDGADVELRDLRKSFGDNEAVKGITFTIDEGRS